MNTHAARRRPAHEILRAVRSEGLLPSDDDSSRRRKSRLLMRAIGRVDSFGTDFWEPRRWAVTHAPRSYTAAAMYRWTFAAWLAGVLLGIGLGLKVL